MVKSWLWTAMTLYVTREKCMISYDNFIVHLQHNTSIFSSLACVYILQLMERALANNASKGDACVQNMLSKNRVHSLDTKHEFYQCKINIYKPIILVLLNKNAYAINLDPDLFFYVWCGRLYYRLWIFHVLINTALTNHTPAHQKVCAYHYNQTSGFHVTDCRGDTGIGKVTTQRR